ncbi:hypothetical protein JOD82_002184 [Paenibacillus sp. 1182]|uniref:hypothetical protein n=1 Tax=Paenibacillus sp. 1182 TaxID=2806565 RepID=UPI001AE88127|nr:hypothetical protein [Paenibacillus sp. 1182]MBP1309164.1 hypothetical protein [Paenibacillus sp. 1182]
MDHVKQFVANNTHQLGYIMQIASDQWKEIDPIGALTVGTTAYFEDKHGNYHKILDELELRKKYESYLKNIIRSGEPLNEEQTFAWFCKEWSIEK